MATKRFIDLKQQVKNVHLSNACYIVSLYLLGFSLSLFSTVLIYFTFIDSVVLLI